ncbi:MAG: PilZ domain-containing protein [Methylotenera sp.]|nr:PilZ domain-containing protein [Oligoflexia bacterium]
MSTPPPEASQDKKFVAAKPEEARALIQNAIKTRSKVLIWTQQQKYRLTSKLESTFESGSSLYLSVTKGVEEAEFETNLKREGIEECLFSASLPSEVIFFKANLRKSAQGLLHFKLQDPVYKVQRRRSLRMPLGNAPVHFRLAPSAPSLPDLSCLMIDVSDGGFGMTTDDEALSQRLVQGVLLEEVAFTLGGRSFVLTAEIMYRKEIPATNKLKKHFRLGLVFRGIREQDAEYISKFVFEESSRFFGRL